MSTPLPDDYRLRTSRMAFCLAGILALSACDEAGEFLGGGSKEPETKSATALGIEFTEEDVEAPEVFSTTEAGLWDGRPSLGGVWVAHPDVTQPERVVIRNQFNGQFVIGALFRRERDVPGPRLQLSSDAAQAIGVLAGAPVSLDVVALRTKQVEVAQPEPEAAPETAVAVAVPQEIEAETLDPIAAAEAAIDAPVPDGTGGSSIAPAAVASAAVGAATLEDGATEEALPVSRLRKPFVQVAIFSVQENANQVDQQMRSLGLTPTIVEEGADDTKQYRVLVGPAMTWNERRLLVRQIKAEGYPDAFAVPN